KPKEYKRVNLILNVENNTIALNKEIHKSHKSGKSMRNKDKHYSTGKIKSSKKKKKNKRKHEKKHKIKKSRSRKEVKFDPYLVPNLMGPRGQHDHPLQSVFGNEFSQQQQLPMNLYFPNMNSYPVQYINTPTFKNTRSSGDFTVLGNGIVVDYNKHLGVANPNDLHSLGGLSDAKPQESPFDRGKALLPSVNIKNQLQPALNDPAAHGRTSYGRSVTEDDQKNIADNTNKDVAGYWVIPNYSPENTGYWVYPVSGGKSD
ncbi:unnamed protein product, partial [Meganyctiphanes norvegica]